MKRRPTSRPCCAACARQLAELLRDEGMSFDDAQALSRTKALMDRAGDGWVCPRGCGNAQADPRLVKPRIVPTRRRPLPTLAELAAGLAREAAEERLRRDRREAARAARRAAREAT